MKFKFLCPWSSFIGTQPNSFIYELSVAVFMWQWESWVVVTETMWSAKLAFTEMLAEPPSKGWACEGLEKLLKDEEEGSDQGQEELEAPNWWLPHWMEPQSPRDPVSAPEVAHIFWDHLVRGHQDLWPVCFRESAEAKLTRRKTGRQQRQPLSNANLGFEHGSCSHDKMKTRGPTLTVLASLTPGILKEPKSRSRDSFPTPRTPPVRQMVAKPGWICFRKRNKHGISWCTLVPNILFIFQMPFSSLGSPWIWISKPFFFLVPLTYGQRGKLVIPGARCLSTPVASVSAQHPLWLVAKRLCRAPNISAGEQPRFNLLLHSGCRIC